MEDTHVWILYTNWKGDTKWKLIQPIRIWKGKTSFHPKSCYLLNALDVEKQAVRDFALKDIKKWEEGPFSTTPPE